MNLRTIRSMVLFVAGIAGIAYETLIEQGEKPTLLILFAAMIGLPAFLAVDESRRKPSENASDKEAAS